MGEETVYCQEPLKCFQLHLQAIKNYQLKNCPTIFGKGIILSNLSGTVICITLIKADQPQAAVCPIMYMWPVYPVMDVPCLSLKIYIIIIIIIIKIYVTMKISYSFYMRLIKFQVLPVISQAGPEQMILACEPYVHHPAVKDNHELKCQC